MSESNQEGYQTLGWIINKSEYGLFLVIAEEEMQNEIARVYHRGMVKIYDYKEHPKAYSFLDLKKWIDTFPEIQTFLIINFQFAVQSEDDLKRLNFSRDMMADLGKNLIFCTTPHGDDMLAGEAYDFYSFIRIRILFSNYNDTVSEEDEDLKADFLQESFSQEEEWDSEEAKKKLKEVDTLLREGREAEEKQEYHKRELILLEAMEIGKKILGSEHLKMAVIYNDLAGLYKSQGKYKEAEELYKKAISIDKKILGENHIDTAIDYNNLAQLYERQGKYKEAEELYKKAISIDKKILGENHIDTAVCYNNLAGLYESQGKYKEAQELYKKVISIKEKILGENHINIAVNYNNLAGLYESRGKYKKAEELYKKAISIDEKILGENHISTAVDYNNLAVLYENQEKYEEAEKLYKKALSIHEKILGEHHPDTIIIKENLANLNKNRK